MAKRRSMLLVIVYVVFGADVEAQYHGERMAPTTTYAFDDNTEAQYYGERMAPPTILAPLTTDLYDIRADAQAAHARQEAAARRERLHSFIEDFAWCIPICGVVPGAAAATLPFTPFITHVWTRDCVVNCLADATGLFPDYYTFSYRKVPRSGEGHPTHPPLRKRIDRLLKALKRRRRRRNGGSTMGTPRISPRHERDGLVPLSITKRETTGTTAIDLPSPGNRPANRST